MFLPPPPPPAPSTLGPFSLFASLIRTLAFVCSRGFFFCVFVSPRRVHLRHRRKQNSHAHRRSKPGTFNRALFSAYNCERSVTAGQTNPIHDQPLILGGSIVFWSQRRNKQMILTRDASNTHIYIYIHFFPCPCGTRASKPGSVKGTRGQPRCISCRSSMLVSLILR